MILGAILAGGQSRRFGSDKAMARFDGMTMIDRIAADLAAVTDGLIVCGAPRNAITAVPDRPRADLGPLGGLCAALHHAREQGYEAVLSVPCDTPLLDRAQLGDLAAQPGSAFLTGLPVIGRWAVDLSDALDNYLRGPNDRSVRGWAAAVDAIPLPWPVPVNVNSPDDLERLSGG